MTYSLQITFRNMAPSAAIENHVREKLAKLESFCDRISAAESSWKRRIGTTTREKPFRCASTLACPAARS
jgi:ribosome-associated translation inhibitor RaiA